MERIIDLPSGPIPAAGVLALLVAALVLLAAGVAGLLAGRVASPRAGARVVRGRSAGRCPARRRAGWLRARASAHLRLWERMLTAHQPWSEHGDLRWARDGRGWRLDGETLPVSSPAPSSGHRRGLPRPRGRSPHVDRKATGGDDERGRCR